MSHLDLILADLQVGWRRRAQRRRRARAGAAGACALTLAVLAIGSTLPTGNPAPAPDSQLYASRLVAGDIALWPAGPDLKLPNRPQD